MLLRWCKPLHHRAAKQPFAKENENRLANTYIKRRPTKSIKLTNIFISEVQLITTSELPLVEFIKFQLLSSNIFRFLSERSR